jgi:hypothetical protein
VEVRQQQSYLPPSSVEAEPTTAPTRDEPEPVPVVDLLS